MQVKKFKTNLSCNHCINKITPYIKALDWIKHWEVDLNSSDRLLTIIADEIKAEEVVKALNEAGYNAEVIEEQKD
ncbi:MAG: heavy-metal-associated domain-containing protein [Ignavibacteria bacterium]